MKTLQAYLWLCLMVLLCGRSGAVAQGARGLGQGKANPYRIIIKADPSYRGETQIRPTLPTGPNAAASGALSSDGADIRIFPSANPQSEVHISVNKSNPNNILASANTYWYLGNSVQGYYVTTNGGTSWFGSDTLPNGGGGRGDPSTAFDASGKGYLVTMSSPDPFSDPDGYFVQRTTNFGVSWLPQVRGTGPTAGFDKPMSASDNLSASPYFNNFYCAWTDFAFSDCSNLTGISVKCNRSTDGGSTFTSPVVLKSVFGQGANVQTGPNGEVYVCWAEYGSGVPPATGIGFAKSANGGQSFSPAVIAFPDAGIRIDPCSTGGEDPLFNYTRVDDFPSMAVDKSGGAFRGRIYIVYPEKENGNGKAVIRLRYSTDAGSSWSAGTTVSIAAGRQNWFPWVAVDDQWGDVSIVYYSFDSPSGFSTNTYVAHSTDGGGTFENVRVSDVAHTTAPIPGFGGGYAGDYIGIAAFDHKAYPAWMDDRNGTWQVYVSPVAYQSCDLVLQNQTLTGTQTFEACNSITAGPNLTIAAGADVTFHVTVSPSTGIRLEPGFTAANGSLFRAYIGGGAGAAVRSRNPDPLADGSTAGGWNNPATSALVRNFPNPFNPSTTISYALPVESDVVLSVYNILGQEVRILVSERQTAGDHSVSFRADELPSGVYYCRLQTASSASMQRMLLMK